MANQAQNPSAINEWMLEYYDYDPQKEKSRESLLAVGNGYLGVRGALEEHQASDHHYPGTYIAGLYNRLISKVAGRAIENEDFVNCPNWIGLSFRIDQGDWFDIDRLKLLSIHRQLNFRNGVLYKKMVVEDQQGRQTQIVSERLAGMANPHLLAISYKLKALNYTGRVELKSSLDGQIINDGVARYRSLNQQHLGNFESGFSHELPWIRVETVQSRIQIAMAVQHQLWLNGASSPVNHPGESPAGKQILSQIIELSPNQEVALVKFVSVYTSKPDDSIDPLNDALAALEETLNFEQLKIDNENHWSQIWQKIDIKIKTDLKSQMLIRLHLYHMMVSASVHNPQIDAGIPARGLHGEAYRGHVFWDELYILPLYNLFLPDVTRSVLMYRYRRLDAARKYAADHGYQGAMFPWQSGSDGREETQIVHLNPLSGEWGDDYSSLQRHISIAIAYNVWYYFQVTDDQAFMESYGAELFLDICRFWASKCRQVGPSGRYSIAQVMGPDEFHEEHPNSPDGGVKDNAYTNLMVAWLFQEAGKLYPQLSGATQEKLKRDLSLEGSEINKWAELADKLNLVVSSDGILAQFDGYFELEELDWDAYRKKYGNIYRLDRILKAEGKSPDHYKFAKQADNLMSFYNLDPDVIHGLLKNMSYPADPDLLSKNYQYYIQRTSHGSTLSRVVHAYLANLMNEPQLAWTLYKEALESDYNDIQGGTTAEGIHAGVMGGTALMVITSFAGINLMNENLHINPVLPADWDEISFSFTFKQVNYQFHISKTQIEIELQTVKEQDVFVMVRDKKIVLQGNGKYQIHYK